jgi:alcohol dehydrogenase
MRAVVYSGYGIMPELTQVPDPACPPDGAVIAVGASGVCRSDWHAWKGHDPVALPHIGGHELAGAIVQTGPEVTRWQAGDRVTVPFVCGCGRCEYCLAGDAQVCPHQTQPGFTGPGSFAELVAVHPADANLVRVPEAVDLVAAACLGCRFATAFRAVTAHGRIRAGEWLAVHGCGGVGLSAVMIGAALRARVVAVDVAAQALDRARELGASFTVSADAGDPSAEIVEITGGGAHVSVDALGSPGTAAWSVRCLRRRGRHVQVGLLLGGPTPVPMDLVVARELEIYGSHGMAARDYPPMMTMVADGTLSPGLLVGQVIGLEDAGAALAAMDRPAEGAGMTVIRISLPAGGESARRRRHKGRTTTSAGSIATISSGSLVMTGCPRSRAQMATLTSTTSAIRVAAHRVPTRSAILASSGTTDVLDARSSRATRTWRALPRQAWASTPAGTASFARPARASSTSTAIRLLPDSSAISAFDLGLWRRHDRHPCLSRWLAGCW